MKAILKHVANQYILIVDERPTINEWYLDDADNVRLSYVSDTTFWLSRGNYCKILAHENLDGVKGIKFKDKEYILSNIPKHVRFRDDETTWKEYLEQYIDTEVEVTEKEDYYLIRL